VGECHCSKATTRLAPFRFSLPELLPPIFGRFTKESSGLNAGKRGRDMLQIGINVWSASLSGTMPQSMAQVILASEPNGLAIGADGSMSIKDVSTPSNNMNGDITEKFSAYPSTKWLIGENGLYSSGTNLRPEYNASGSILGLRVEGQRTNLALRSQEINNGSWTRNRLSTVTTDAITAPDGALTAEKIVEDTTSGQHYVQQVITTVASSVYTASAFFKAGERSVAIIASDGFRANFNLTNGTVSETAGSPIASSITPVGNGWYLCALTFAAADTSQNFQLATCNAPTGFSYLGDGVSGLHIWQAQYELGVAVSSPIPTTSAQVTRSADDLTLATSLFGFSSTEGSLCATFRPSDISSECRAVQLDDGTENERFSLGNDSSGAGMLAVVDGGAGQTGPLTAGTVNTTDHEELAASWGTDDFKLSSDGGAASVDTAGSLPTVTTLRLGCGNSFVSPLNGHLKRLMILPRKMSAAELQSWP